MSTFHAKTNRSPTRANEPWWSEISHHLGAVYPFYDVNVPDHFSLDIEDIIQRRQQRGESVELDPFGLACKTCLPHLLGDRTLVRNVRRTPWVSRYVSAGEWKAADLPSHGDRTPDPEEFVRRLKKALVEEAASYVEGARTAGVLLSGGMDSRVVAGVLRDLQVSTGCPERVVAITWGQPDSRDLIYAGRIADRFEWEWRRFSLDAASLLENIETAGRMGAEVSPVHLHALPRVAKLEGVDVFLAGSYGDSVGRAEFSGRRVRALRPILRRAPDRFGLLRSSLLREVLPVLMEDAVASPHLAREASLLRRHEIQQGLHYMRRMLQTPMLIIAQRHRFYQMFTAPAVFGLMWSLLPAQRNDEWYRRLLQLLPGDLLDIPWARTGRLYMKNEGTPDQWERLHHSYASWLRNELHDVVVDRVNGNVIRGLGVFNDCGLDNALECWAKARTETVNALDQVMSWLASLHTFVERNRLSCNGVYARSPTDLIRGVKGRLRAATHVAHVRVLNWLRE